MKWHEVEEFLQKQGLVLFSSQEFRRATGFSPASAKHLLIRYVQKGLVLRLKEKRGLYCLKGKPPHPWHLANRLLQPSYISLETALAHYGIIPESVYAVTSVTPRITRSFEALNLTFSFHKIKREAYAGYRPLEIQGQTVLLGEPEKAMADYLYFVHLGKKSLNDRIRWNRLKKASVMSYLKRFARVGLVEWAKHVV
jgi:predicted transcriptional regulator of viral defense system